MDNKPDGEGEEVVIGIMEKVREYYWVPLLAMVVLGSWWLSIRAWDYLHYPIIAGMFWSPLYRPSYPEWQTLLMLIPTVLLMWWYSSILFQIPYLFSMFWLLWWICSLIRTDESIGNYD